MAVERRYWLMKSEPDVFSIDDLARSPKQTTAWDGVRNYQARNFMRAMKVGDWPPNAQRCQGPLAGDTVVDVSNGRDWPDDGTSQRILPLLSRENSTGN